MLAQNVCTVPTEGQPFWLQLLRPHRCHGCGAVLDTQQRGLYFPASRRIFGYDCGCGRTLAEDWFLESDVPQVGNHSHYGWTLA